MLQLFIGQGHITYLIQWVSLYPPFCKISIRFRGYFMFKNQFYYQNLITINQQPPFLCSAGYFTFFFSRTEMFRICRYGSLTSSVIASNFDSTLFCHFINIRAFLRHKFKLSRQIKLFDSVKKVRLSFKRQFKASN